MKTLTEHNTERILAKSVTEFGAGVKCDICGTELKFSGRRFMSNPPMSAVNCPNEKCKWFQIDKPMR